MSVMKITKILAIIAMTLGVAGCYEQHSDVAPREYVTDESFEAMFPEAVHISIAELKAAFGPISKTGVNSSWSNTIYKLIGEDIFAGHDVYIKGKVVSNDDEGNVYKSLYIQDETTGIELKLNNNVGLRYKYGTWVYVRLTGLYLGNYRMMLSLGGAPSESYNKAGEHKYYANSNIELQEIIDEHVFAGRKAEIVEGSYDQWLRYSPSVDVITVTKDNYKEVFSSETVELEGKFIGTNSTDANGLTRKLFTMPRRELMFGRLIRFEGLTCRYAGVPNQDGVTNPALKSGSFENIYPSWLYTDPRPTVSKGWYQWAYKEEITGRSLYGSVLFTYNPNPVYCSEDGVYALRTSGYSRFARRNVCKDGEVVDIRAIYGIYAQQSTYAGNADDYASYQLTISSFSDLKFHNGESALLTDEQVERMTTEDMKYVPWIDEEGESDVM